MMSKSRTLIAAIVLALTLSACGSGTARSVEAYCDTVAQHRDRYLSAMDAATSSGGLDGLLGGVSAIGDINNMWSDLAGVAPDEIRSDTEAVKEAWEESEEAASSGDIFGMFTSAFTNLGPTERVNTYIAENCGAEYVP